MLSSEKEINAPCGTLTCKSQSMINFYTSGEIKSLFLAKPATVTVGTEKFSAKNEMTLSKEGKVLTCYIAESNGFSTRYGKVYPNTNYQVAFYSDGALKSLVSEDVTEVIAGGLKLSTEANTQMCFSKNGVITKATVTGNKVKFYGWNIDTGSSAYTFIVYPNKRIFIIDVNEVSINKQKIFYYYGYTTSILLDKDNCYTWSLDDNKQLYIYNKSSEKLSQKSFTPNPTYLNKDGEIDFSRPPLIFDENNNLIGYKKGLAGRIFDENTDIYYSSYEYNPYEKDILF